MGTFKNELREYNDFMAGTAQPTTTRGLVVSNIDPLFAGRVKVWIPALHGPTPYGPTGDFEGLDPDQQFSKVSSSTNFKNSKTISALPWAAVLSHNLGPILDINTNVSTTAGSFSIPAVGTEVMIVFENNNPLLPIVVGSIIHANEFRYSLARPFEYLPGMILSEVTQIDNKVDPASAIPVIPEDYPSLASSVYNVRTASGSTLFMSDNKSSRSIVLEGSIAYNETSTLNTKDIFDIANMYPAFPTTASAAFAKREALSGHSISPLSVPSGITTNEEAYTSSVTIITSEQIQKNAVDPNINIQSNNSSTIKQGLASCAASGRINKNWPVTGTPRFSGGGGLFLAPRPNGRKHAGIDLGVNTDASTALLAPIDCYPLYFGGVLYATDLNTGGRVSAGITLMVLGIDGYGHTFMHMREVDKNIIDICQSGKTTLIKAGTHLGQCGVTIKSTHNTGPHLHWEVFPAPHVETGSALYSARQSAVHNLTVIHPAKEWMVAPGSIKNSPAVNTTSTITTGTPDQIAHQLKYTLSYPPDELSNFSKPAGLEMSLTPGKESIMLRHPSGSFIGFDPDGNILFYSCGDINFRANRSITYDVLGAIIESSYAKFSRVRTVVKNWARVFSNRKAKDVADSTMPDFFSRLDNSRAIDMANALASTVNNSFIIDSDGNSINPDNLPSDTSNTTSQNYVSPPVFTFTPDYSLSFWDSLLQNLYETYISAAPESVATKIFPDKNVFKAMMLLASNGNPSFTGDNSSNFGLFQINDEMINIIKGFTISSTDQQRYIGTSITDSTAAALNADIAVQYVVRLAELIRDYLTKTSPGFYLDNNNQGGTISSTDFKYLVLLAYKQGLSLTTKAISIASEIVPDRNKPELTYRNVEAVIAKARATEDILSYVPTVAFIEKNLKK